MGYYDDYAPKQIKYKPHLEGSAKTTSEPYAEKMYKHKQKFKGSAKRQALLNRLKSVKGYGQK